MYPMVSVWLIHNNIPPYRVPLFAEIAKRADFDFSVVLTAPKCRHRPHWKTEAELMPYKVLTMKGLNFGWFDSSSVSISLGLLPSLIQRRPDILICSGFSLATLMVFIYSKLFSKKYIVWSEATETTERINQRDRGLRRLIRRILASNAGAFVDAGTLSRAYIKSLLPMDCKVPFFRSYNCVDRAVFSSDMTCAPKANGANKATSRKMLFVGQLIERKGVPMLLEVYRDLVKLSDVPVELVLVGEGPLEEYVREFKCKNALAGIRLEGQVSYDEVARYYKVCDVFVLLSLSDCNPLVIFEALHAGIPIVCSGNAGNAHDFIVPGENGYIVEPEDRKSIVQCLSDVLRWDAAKRTACKQVSREQVAKANYEDSAAAFIKACETVLCE
jgi:glycosyltransferase involved in cell wall biosynthesis